ncbi:hypothetical protein VTO73DRAFT_8275 [Trametes versicolor]
MSTIFSVFVGDPPLNATNSSNIKWPPCDPSVITIPALTCSFFEVPSDCRDPTVGHARLALAKLNGTQGRGLGAASFNPGGPGVSGLHTLNTLTDLLSGLSGELYDVVSWDPSPRGVGSLTISGEVFCFDSPDEYNLFCNGTIQLIGIQMTGNLSDPDDCLGTAATVRDIITLADALASANGLGSPVSFIGASYASLLGMWLIINCYLSAWAESLSTASSTQRCSLLKRHLLHSQVWLHELADADKAYEVFLTGYALAGPQGCSIASAEGQTAADIGTTMQAILRQAHNAARRNASVPMTSELIRGTSLASWNICGEMVG